MNCLKYKERNRIIRWAFTMGFMRHHVFKKNLINVFLFCNFYYRKHTNESQNARYYPIFLIPIFEKVHQFYLLKCFYWTMQWLVVFALSEFSLVDAIFNQKILNFYNVHLKYDYRTFLQFLHIITAYISSQCCLYICQLINAAYVLFHRISTLNSLG